MLKHRCWGQSWRVRGGPRTGSQARPHCHSELPRELAPALSACPAPGPLYRLTSPGCGASHTPYVPPPPVSLDRAEPASSGPAAWSGKAGGTSAHSESQTVRPGGTERGAERRRRGPRIPSGTLGHTRGGTCPHPGLRPLGQPPAHSLTPEPSARLSPLLVTGPRVRMRSPVWARCRRQDLECACAASRLTGKPRPKAAALFRPSPL